MNDREFDELAAGHALHALSPADEHAFQEALAADPLRGAQGRAHEEAVARLADAVPSVEPPRRIRADLLARIAETPQLSQERASESEDAAPAPSSPALPPTRDDSAPAPAAGASGRGPRRWFVLAASVALLVAVSAGAVVTVQSLMRPAAVSALEAIDEAPDARTADATLADGGTVTLHWSPARGAAVLVSDDLPGIEADRQFELWLVRDGTAHSAGAFDPAEEQTIAVLDRSIEPGDVVAVTVEPAGGSPSGQPTTEPIVAIETS